MTMQAYNNDTAISWGNFVDVAYKMYVADPKNTNPSQPDYFPEGWKLVANLNVDPVIGFISEQQFIGFITQSTSDPSQIGFVFRGTIGVFDWFDDFEFLLVDFTDIPNGGKTEDGFTRLYNSLSTITPGSGAQQNLNEYVANLDAGVTVTVTGHSLGGALAILHAAVLANNNPNLNLELYTFAAPMTGNSTFVATFEKLVPNSYRIYNKPDIVPTLPGAWLGYEQVNTGIQINSLLYPIKHSIACYHSMLTYLYVLGSRTYGLGDCAASASATTAASSTQTAAGQT
jgi:hypothetical protein